MYLYAYLHSAVVLLCGLALLLLAGACAHKGGVESVAKENGFIKKQYQSQYFNHLVLHNKLYYSSAYPSGAPSTLYVFIEGDGLPWKTRSQISLNPDPVRPLALELMSLMEYPSVYISRPCYQIRDARCHYQWWTEKRYSQRVVDSMIAVLHKTSVDYDEVTLVGYSGGATLAVLMANSVHKVTRLVTLSGNMNHPEWTQWHAYSPLKGSLNASNYTLPERVSQYHYAAQNDKNILPEWIKTFSEKQKKSRFILLENADHRCCWLNNWENIMRQINAPD